MWTKAARLRGRATILLLPTPTAAPGPQRMMETSWWGSWAVLGDVLGASHSPHHVGWILPFSFFAFTFSQNHLPATCSRCRPQTCLGFLPLPSPPCHASPFRWRMSLRGFCGGGCARWLLAPEWVSAPPSRDAVSGTLQTPLCPGVGPEAILVSSTGVARLHLPCLTPLWGRCDVVSGMACHHPGDSVPPSQGQAGTAPGMGRPHTRDGITCKVRMG